jgi:hypothetical protein
MEVRGRPKTFQKLQESLNEEQLANQQIKYTNERLRSNVTELEKTLNKSYKTISTLLEKKYT